MLSSAAKSNDFALQLGRGHTVRDAFLGGLELEPVTEGDMVMQCLDTICSSSTGVVKTFESALYESHGYSRLQRAPPSAAPWSFYRSSIAEFVATFIFLYVSVCGSVLTVMGISKSPSKCGTVGIQQGIARAFGRWHDLRAASARARAPRG